jgi:hypothetical protein
MSLVSTILVQFGISLLVVACYHLWATRKKQADASPVALPAVKLTPQVAVAPAVPVVPPVVAALPAVEPVPPEILAVIAAAISVVLGRPHRVVTVKQAEVPTPEINIWALEGRLKQFMSHKVR